MTPLLDRNFFIEFQLVSVLPNNLRTAFKTSWIASGGILKFLISSKLDLLIDPTALKASSTNGYILANSILTYSSYLIVFFSSSNI